MKASHHCDVCRKATPHTQCGCEDPSDCSKCMSGWVCKYCEAAMSIDTWQQRKDSVELMDDHGWDNEP